MYSSKVDSSSAATKLCGSTTMSVEKELEEIEVRMEAIRE
jgi:hypothetical protein